jgi:hypothetical protein
MSVFRNYDNTKSGDVNAQAFPRVYSHPWIPSQQNVRSNPNIPSQPQRVQPHERGAFHPTSASGGGTLAPAMSSGGCGCGGNCNGSSQVEAPPTASEVATGHSFHGTSGKVAARPIMQPRPQQRTVGALRSGLRSNARPTLTPFYGGRNTR